MPQLLTTLSFLGRTPATNGGTVRPGPTVLLAEYVAQMRMYAGRRLSSGSWHGMSWCCNYPFVCCDLTGGSSTRAAPPRIGCGDCLQRAPAAATRTRTARPTGTAACLRARLATPKCPGYYECGSCCDRDADCGCDDHCEWGANADCSSRTTATPSGRWMQAPVGYHDCGHHDCCDWNSDCANRDGAWRTGNDDEHCGVGRPRRRRRVSAACAKATMTLAVGTSAGAS